MISVIRLARARSGRRRAAVLAGGAAVAVVVAVGTVGSPAWAADPPPLGAAADYGVLAGTTATNTGPTVINGDLGVTPGAAVVGFPPGVVNGDINAANAAAVQAQAGALAAYNSAEAEPAVTIPTELGGTTITPGAYDSASGDLEITGELILDGLNAAFPPVFVFKTTGTLVTASDSSITFINGADACNVFWQVGTSATLGTGSEFAGTILAVTSVTATTGVTVDGRLLARNGAVTMDTNTISEPGACPQAAPPGPGDPGGPGGPDVPNGFPETGAGGTARSMDDGSLLLGVSGLAVLSAGAVLIVAIRRRRTWPAGVPGNRAAGD